MLARYFRIRDKINHRDKLVANFMPSARKDL
ncbi:TPA: hypothetical protein N0F65_004030 [Lagenidium giganteum]|uniref:Uncharacterized protein n=1 Tax=Lagenidium giganteum TaxID=4803 RepID=A0AAV2YT52_9STRA|nr:TPA: hypothetical protein N0F65_004030 [Lagenidium giganteum]